MFSLTLDGLAQEAGALARPFIEYSELLTYFRMLSEAVNAIRSPSVRDRPNAFHPLIAVFQRMPETNFLGVMQVAHLSSAIEPRLINPSHGIFG